LENQFIQIKKPKFIRAFFIFRIWCSIKRANRNRRWSLCVFVRTHHRDRSDVARAAGG